MASIVDDLLGFLGYQPKEETEAVPTIDIAPAVERDTEFLLRVLREGAVTSNEVLRRSLVQRGCGLTVHSRAADLRRRLADEGLTVVCTRQDGRNDFGKSEYLYALEPVGSIE